MPRLAAYLAAAHRTDRHRQRADPRAPRPPRSLQRASCPARSADAAAAATVVIGLLLLLLAHGAAPAQAPGLARGRGRCCVASVALPHRQGRTADRGEPLCPAARAALVTTGAEFYARGRPAHPLACARYARSSCSPASRWCSACCRDRVPPQRPGRVAPSLGRSLEHRSRSAWSASTVRCSSGSTGTTTSSARAARLGPDDGDLTTVYLVLRPPEPPAAADRRRRGADARRCWPSTAHATRSATSRCAGTRACSGRRRGKACIAYRVVSGVMLASGDPLGDPEAWPGAIKRFLDEADRHAWTPAVMGCSELGGEVWCREAGATTRSSSATRRSSRSPTSPSRAGRCATSGRWSTGSSGPATRRQVRRVRDLARRPSSLRRPAGHGLARHRHRARLLDGAGPVRRPGRRRLRRLVTRAQGRRAARAPALRALGRGRALARPDAARPLGRPRPQRAADRGRRCRRRRELGVTPDLAELRGLPRRAGARRAARRRSGARGLARRCWSSPRAGSRSSRSTGSTPSSAPIWEPRFVCYPAVGDLPRIAVAALEAEAFIVWPRPHLRGRPHDLVGSPDRHDAS